MKREDLIKIAMAVFFLVCIAATSLPVRQVVVINSSTALPVAITNRSVSVFSVTFWGLRGDRTTNTSCVWIGVTGTNNTAQTIPVDPGQWVTVTAAPGTKFNLTQFSLDVGTANDGVVVHYQPEL